MCPLPLPLPVYWYSVRVPRVNPRPPPPRVAQWHDANVKNKYYFKYPPPPHFDIVITNTNIVCTLYVYGVRHIKIKGGSGRAVDHILYYIAQKSRQSLAVVCVMQMGGGKTGMDD